MEFILASSSPRRRDLLSLVGITYRVIPSTVEEKLEGDTPAAMVMSLAKQKAEDVFKRCSFLGDRVVLGADTIVVCDGKKLGKPVDAADALITLKLLGNRSHEVYTGVCLYICRKDKISCEQLYECTRVTMNPISDELARWYINTGEPMDKAGAYGIQGLGAVLVKGIEGDYNNVVGLPLARVWHRLGELGLLQECTYRI